MLERAYETHCNQYTAIVATTSPSTTAFVFADTPVLSEVSDELGDALTAASFDGGVSIEPPGGFEGDVAPLPLGNDLVSITDWVKVGRLASQLESVVSSLQFQRADCAPRSSLGNGAITVSDWVQAGRYAVGLDPLAQVLDAEFQASILEILPVLEIVLSGDNVVLSWPESAADFHLESAAQLGNTAEWGPVQETAELADGAIRVRLPLEAAGRFLRLRK